MKKLGIIFIIIIFIPRETPHEEIYELADLAVIAMENNLTTEEWNVTLKEKVSNKQVQQYLSVFKKDHLVKREEHKNVVKYIIKNDGEMDNIDITYEIIIPQDHKYFPELIATITGTHLSAAIVEEYEIALKHARNRFFTKKYRLFTCLTTSKNDMIANDDFSKSLSKNLDLKYVSAQSDMINEISYQEMVYGYTPLWNNEFLIENKPLNIQIVIQGHKNEKQKVIIGTPILLTEY